MGKTLKKFFTWKFPHNQSCHQMIDLPAPRDIKVLRPFVGILGMLPATDRLNQDICPVHLPGQNIFCTRQNNFCPRQNIFVPDKKFCPKLKEYICIAFEMDGKWLFSYGKFFSTARNSLFILFPSKYEIFSLGQKNFVQDKKYFVWADGQGKSFYFDEMTK